MRATRSAIDYSSESRSGMMNHRLSFSALSRQIGASGSGPS
jgi:hypothetical protein